MPQRIWWGAIQGLVALAILTSLLIYGAYQKMPEADLRAFVFSALVLVNMGLILVNRSFKASLAGAFLRPNRSLYILLSIVTAILAITIYWPPAQRLFHFGQLHWNDLVICLVASVVSLLVLEGIKAKWFRVV